MGWNHQLEYDQYAWDQLHGGPMQSARRRWIYSSILDNVGDGNIMYTFTRTCLLFLYMCLYMYPYYDDIWLSYDMI